MAQGGAGAILSTVKAIHKVCSTELAGSSVTENKFFNGKQNEMATGWDGS